MGVLFMLHWFYSQTCYIKLFLDEFQLLILKAVVLNFILLTTVMVGYGQEGVWHEQRSPCR